MRHEKILSLIRAGALYEAEKEYIRLGLDAYAVGEDEMALGGRLLKSKALEHTGKARKDLALEAAQKYGRAYAETGGTYSGINMAAMYCLAGEREEAARIAGEVLAKTRAQRPKPGEAAYYHMATVAEAQLILGEDVSAERSLRDAVGLDPQNYPARATTIRQFEMLLDALERPHDRSRDWLDALRPPKCLHYAGHMFAGDAGTPADLRALDAAIDAYLDTQTIGFAFGGLAAGADIIIAEKLLARGVELHLVFPCPIGYYRTASITPSGPEWEERFYGVIARATSVRTVSHEAELPDPLMIAFGSEVAMGLAVLKAQEYATSAEQVLVWDGEDTDFGAGTAHDGARWRATGRAQTVIPFTMDRLSKQTGQESGQRIGQMDASEAAPPHCTGFRGARSIARGDNRSRAMRAIIFADFRGFASLRDSQIPVFQERIFSAVADVCAAHAREIIHQNTWGDGIFIVLKDPADAAALALDMRAAFEAIDVEALDLPGKLALRVAGHYGPVHALRDPFTGGDTILGSQVTLAAKLEPVTKPGSIYVSEPFACALALKGDGQYEYAAEIMDDTIQLHKSSDQIPVFSLRLKGQGNRIKAP